MLTSFCRSDLRIANYRESEISPTMNYAVNVKTLHTQLTFKRLTIFEVFIEFAIGCQDKFCAWVH